MGGMNDILPPLDEDDIKGAERVFENFFTLYQPTLTRVDQYLKQVMREVGPVYAEAYRPWQIAIHDLASGLFLMAKKIPLPDKERFTEALSIFTFDGAVRFLYDLCASCMLQLDRDWIKRFTQHIHMLLFSLDILTRQQQPSLTR